MAQGRSRSSSVRRVFSKLWGISARSQRSAPISLGADRSSCDLAPSSRSRARRHSNPLSSTAASAIVLQAAKRYKAAEFESCIRSLPDGFRLDADENGRNALHLLGCQKGAWKQALMLAENISREAIIRPDNNGKILHHYFAEYQNREAMEKLIGMMGRYRDSFPLHLKDCSGRNSFHYMASNFSFDGKFLKTVPTESLECVVSAKDREFRTALEMACLSRNDHFLKTLVSLVVAQESQHLPQLLFNEIFGRLQLKSLQVLLRLVAKSEIREAFVARVVRVAGVHAIHALSKRLALFDIREQLLAVCNSSWGDLCAQLVTSDECRGATALHFACQGGQTANISLLMAEGLRLQDATASGDTCVDWAVRAGRLDAVHLADSAADHLLLRLVDPAPRCLQLALRQRWQLPAEAATDSGSEHAEEKSMGLNEQERAAAELLVEALQTDSWRPLLRLPPMLPTDAEFTQCLHHHLVAFPGLMADKLPRLRAGHLRRPVSPLQVALLCQKLQVAPSLLLLRQWDLIPCCLQLLLHRKESQQKMPQLQEAAQQLSLSALQRLSAGANSEEKRQLLRRWLCGGFCGGPRFSSQPRGLGDTGECKQLCLLQMATAAEAPRKLLLSDCVVDCVSWQLDKDWCQQRAAVHLLSISAFILLLGCLVFAECSAADAKWRLVQAFCAAFTAERLHGALAASLPRRSAPAAGFLLHALLLAGHTVGSESLQHALLLLFACLAAAYSCLHVFCLRLTAALADCLLNWSAVVAFVASSVFGAFALAYAVAKSSLADADVANATVHDNESVDVVSSSSSGSSGSSSSSGSRRRLLQQLLLAGHATSVRLLKVHLHTFPRAGHLPQLSGILLSYDTELRLYRMCMLLSLLLSASILGWVVLRTQLTESMRRRMLVMAWRHMQLHARWPPPFGALAAAAEAAAACCWTTTPQSQPGSRNVSQPESRDVSQSGSRDVSQPGSRDVSQPASRDVSQSGSRDVSQTQAWDVGHPGSWEGGQSSIRASNQSALLHSVQPLTQGERQSENRGNMSTSTTSSSSHISSGSSSSSSSWWHSDDFNMWPTDYRRFLLMQAKLLRSWRAERASELMC